MLETRYDHIKVEADKYEKWKKGGYFTAGDISKQKFSMVIPPPNVTGKLHLGHAMDTTTQDIIARYKKSKGFDVLWVPGMDHAGIATQAKVEERLRKEGISRYDLGREKFLETAWKWKDEYAQIIHEQWGKLGLSLDYTRERFTLDEGLNKAVNKVFKTLYDEGLIYRGERIINWDPVLRTALSNIEVIHKEIKGDFFYFKYKVVGTDIDLIVATTRPETMFGDVCLTVNPNDERYKEFVGKMVINPANLEQIPVIADSYVDIKFGTGVMKCTPAHDPNDFIIGEKYHFPHPVVMDETAHMNEKCGKYKGMDRFECRKALVEDLKKAGNLVKIESTVHSVGHSERSNSIVEPYLSKQWFVKMKPLAEQAIKLQNSKDAVEFIPSRFNKVFLKWMDNIEDWCISRQLWWGHRIPAYYNIKTGDVLVSEVPPVDIENYKQDEDVLDTWFSSGLWPFSSLGWPEMTPDFLRYYPTDIISPGYDIIFFWVSRMINQGIHFTGKKPFDKALIHGLIRDSKGRKMSKSLGNGVDPIEVIDTYGADALRYFLATSSTPGQDMRYSDEKVQSCANFLNKIWNAARFTLLNIEDYNGQEIDIKSLSDIDKYILTKLEETINIVTKRMDKYKLGAASNALYNFVYDDFCSYYIELSKVTLNDPLRRKNTQAVLLKVLKAIIMMIYPYSPFISEEIYQNLPNHKASIMIESYPLYEKKYKFKDAIAQVELLRNMIKDIRNYKVTNSLAPNAPVKLNISTELQLFSDFDTLLRKFSFASEITYLSNNSNNLATSFIYPNVVLSVMDNTSKAELIEKLNKELEFENNEIARGQKLLGNPNFVAKAPKEKLAVEQEKLAKHLEAKQLIENKLKNL